jgi:hypothetical protein
MSAILDKNQLNLMRLVHAMHSNGPLPQVLAVVVVVVVVLLLWWWL